MMVLSREETHMTNTELVLILSPIVIIQLLMFAYCAYLISKEGVRNLNKPTWLLICLLFQILGPIAFIVLGRKDI